MKRSQWWGRGFNFQSIAAAWVIPHRPACCWGSSCCSFKMEKTRRAKDRLAKRLESAGKWSERGILYLGWNFKYPHAEHKTACLNCSWSWAYLRFLLVYHSHTGCWWRPPVKRRIQLLDFWVFKNNFREKWQIFFLEEPVPIKVFLICSFTFIFLTESS